MAGAVTPRVLYVAVRQPELTIRTVAASENKTSALQSHSGRRSQKLVMVSIAGIIGRGWLNLPRGPRPASREMRYHGKVGSLARPKPGRSPTSNHH
jgi:hypothetical protein